VSRAVGLASPEFQGVIERVKIVEYAQALQLRNPIHLDVAAARAAGFRDLVAPTGFINPFSLQPRAWKFETFQINEHKAVAGEWSWEQRDVICAGDELHGRSVLVELTEKQGKRPMDVLVIETAYLNDKNETVVTVRDVTLEFKDRA
jgi:acyl dehydratase